MLNRKRIVLLFVTLAALAVTTLPVVAQETQPATEQPVLREVTPADQPAADGAQPATTPAEGEGKAAPEQRPPTLFDNPMFLVVMFGGLALLWFWSSRTRKKQESKRREMLASLKKGDKVTSIGGIIGTVIEVKEDEVTVKVDETNNVRMKFARWAIRGVGEAAKTETPEDKK